MQKVNSLMLAGILIVVVYIAGRPQVQIGRFVTTSNSQVLLDTTTGRLCSPPGIKELGTTPILPDCQLK